MQYLFSFEEFNSLMNEKVTDNDILFMTLTMEDDQYNEAEKMFIEDPVELTENDTDLKLYILSCVIENGKRIYDEAELNAIAEECEIDEGMFRAIGGVFKKSAQAGKAAPVLKKGPGSVLSKGGLKDQIKAVRAKQERLKAARAKGLTKIGRFQTV